MQQESEVYTPCSEIHSERSAIRTDCALQHILFLRGEYEGTSMRVRDVCQTEGLKSGKRVHDKGCHIIGRRIENQWVL